MGKLNQSTEFLPFELNAFLQQKKLTLIQPLAKGWSSWVYLVKNTQGKQMVLKFQRPDSPRKQASEREFENLKIANTLDIGPKVLDFDFKQKIILMEFVNGITLDQWMLDQEHSKKEIQQVLKELLEQAKKLDQTGLDHGQLGGRGTWQGFQR